MLINNYVLPNMTLLVRASARSTQISLLSTPAGASVRSYQHVMLRETPTIGKSWLYMVGDAVQNTNHRQWNERTLAPACAKHQSALARILRVCA
jgi:hypothetical protein